MLRNKRGAVILIFAVALTVLLGATALVVDIGSAYAAKSHLVRSMDSAAIAGAMELPGNPTLARQVAIDYLEQNGVSPTDVNIEISSDNKSITLTGSEEVEFYFARVLGINSAPVGGAAKAMAIVGAPTGLSGVKPFGLELKDYTFGESIVIKVGALNGDSGNYNYLALGGTGSSTLKENILYGYDGILQVYNDSFAEGSLEYNQSVVLTEPGNMPNNIQIHDILDGSTWTNYTEDSMNLWIVPIVQMHSEKSGGRYDVRILGFAQIYVEDIVNVKDKGKGHDELTARFIKTVTSQGDVDPEAMDTGLYSVNLVKP